jgi:fibronectin-binding autotransporter adhesin
MLKFQSLFRVLQFLLIGGLVCGSFPSVAFGQTRTWTNSGASDWFTPGNWSGTTVPTASNDAVIRSNGTANIAGAEATAKDVFIGSGRGSNDGTLFVASSGTLAADSVTVGGGAFSGANGTLNLEGLLITESVTKGAVFFAPTSQVNFNGGTLQATADGSLLTNFGAGDVTFQAGGGTIDSNGFDVTVLAPLDGAGRLTKVGAGTLILTHVLTANSFSGGTLISDGTLQVGNGLLNGALGSGDVVNNSALVLYPNLLSMTVGNAISGSGTLEKRGFGQLTLTGSNSYTGLTTISEGTLRLGDGGTSGTLGTNDVINNGQLAFNRSDAQTLFNQISGSGGVRQIGSGTTQLTGSNSYAGGTVINNGVLVVTENANLGQASGTLQFGDLLSGGGTLRVDGPGFTMNRDTTLGLIATGTFDVTTGALVQQGVISGFGSLAKTGDGTLELSGLNTYSGGTKIAEGTLRTTSAMALGSGPVILNGGVLDPVGTLNTGEFTWNGGKVATDLGTETDFINVNGNLQKGPPGEFEFAAVTGFSNNTTYQIFNADNMEFLNPLTDFTGNALFNLAPVFSIVGEDLYVNFMGTPIFTGAVLQNSNPVDIPTFADFVINGAVTTGSPTENNTINGLIFNPSSSLLVFNTLTVTSGRFTVNGGTGTVSGGTIVTPGDFSKEGGGTLIANSGFNVGGAALLQEGALYVNGNFTTGGGLTIFQNALLGGRGLITGNVSNNGTVNPGNSPGTLSINGNFTQTSSGTLQIEIASPSVFDRLVVSGNAALAGTLQAMNFGGNKLKYGQQFAFLQAGSISGDFDRILMPDPSRFRGRFLAEGGTGTLLVAPTSYTLVAETTNQHNVAKALDSYIPERGNDRETVSIALDLQSEDQYPAAFDAISPAFYESLADITIEQAVSQNQMLAQRMSAVRLGVRGFSAVGIDAPLRYDRDGKSVMEPKDHVAPVVNPNPRWSTWVQGNGIFAKMVSASQVPNYHFQSGGFLVGADYRWSENFTTGLYTGYEYTWADYDGGGNTQINSALFGGYATYDNDGFYADAVFGGGYNGYRVRRPIEFSTVDRTARSTPNGGQLSSYLDFGYDWKVNGFSFGPLVSAQYTYAGIAPFTEDGADSLDLRVDQQNANSIRTNLGARIAYTWNVCDGFTLIPEVRAFWQHEFLENPRNIGASLDGGNGPSFGYETTTPDRDSIFAGAGVSAQFGQNWSASFYYNANFANQDYLSHAISASLEWRF